MLIRNNVVGISVLPPSRAQLEARAKKYGVPLRWIDPRPRHRYQRLYNMLMVLAIVAACVVLYVSVHHPR
ncbi:MAG TPA: hypothetical protein VEC10_11135 [Steroidobacteraceae bacterium]|nr:hypothetical protein [Steroidobacteraceae bacterium]